MLDDYIACVTTDGAGLLERDRAREIVAAALDDAGRGVGGFVVIEATPGGGVSSLVRLCVEGARERGMAAGEARAVPSAEPASFGVARQLFADSWAQLSAGQAPDDPHLIELLAGQARRLGALGPGLVLAIDDLQWCDAASLRLLLALKPWLAELPVLLVVGLHPGGDAAEPSMLAQLLDAPAIRKLSPAPLTAAAVARLAAAALDEDDLPPSFADVCAAVTAGSPWLIEVALDALRSRGLAPTAGHVLGLLENVPGPLARRVARELAGRTPAAAALAGVVAVFGEPIALRDAARLAGLDEDAAGAAADELAGIGMITPTDPLSFRQPLVGGAVAAATATFARARVHRAALDLLRAADASPERLGRHLLHLPPARDPAVVETLREAAARAAAADDRRGAVALLRRARAEPPAAELHTTVLTELALAEFAAGSSRAVQRLAQALEQGDVGDARPRLEVALARALLARGDYREAAAAAAAVAAGLEPSDPENEPLLVVQLIASSVDASLSPAAAERLGRVIGEAFAGDIPEDPGLCAFLAAYLSGVSGPIQTVHALIDRALRDSPLVDDSHQSIQSFLRAALLNIDDVARAEENATAAMEHARQRDLPIAYGLAQHGRALARYGAGRIDEALVDAQESLPLRRSGWTLHVSYDAALLVAVHIDRGELDAAAAALQLAHEHATNGSLQLAYVLHAQALLELAMGEPVAATESAVRAGAALDDFGVHDLSPTCLPWASTAAIAAATADDLDRARALSAGELERARRTELPGTIGVALRACGLAAEGDERVALLREAVASLERSPLRLQLARALLDLGAAIRDRGDRLAARETLAAGLDLADRCGATVLVGRAREELRLAGAKPRRAALTGVAALTVSERRVAELAARGDSNPQIASTLFVSVKTVEGTLARAYRKLEIGSRAELPRALSDPQPGPA